VGRPGMPEAFPGVRGRLPEFVDYPYVARVARVNAAALAALARSPAAPSGALIVPASFTNDTELRWNAGAEPDLAGYEIVLRPTTEPAWTQVIPVGKITSTTLKGISKDNVFFGIRAVDECGNRSPVSFPRPSQ
jgi:hypothetical protein